MQRKRGRLFDRSMEVDGGIRKYYHEAKDKHVTPSKDLSSRTKDRVGPETGVPTKVLPPSSTVVPEHIVNGTPLQPDGTLLTKEASNVRPGPRSTPWFRRNGRDVPAGRFNMILRIDVPQGQVYRVDKIGHTFHTPGDDFWILYDGRMYNNSTWSFPLGTPDGSRLYKLPVTITATKSVICYVRNNSAADRAYEYFLDGWYDPLEHLHGSRTV